jgi:hypothetical protein
VFGVLLGSRHWLGGLNPAMQQFSASSRADLIRWGWPPSSLLFGKKIGVDFYRQKYNTEIGGFAKMPGID